MTPTGASNPHPTITRRANFSELTVPGEHLAEVRDLLAGVPNIIVRDGG